MMCFDSPFNKQLRTNYVPSGIDVSHVQQLLLEPEAELSRLNKKLSQLKMHLDNMKMERDELKDGIDEHYRLLAPFRCLPDDMLREIFLWCLPDDHEATMSDKEPPLVLGRVCQRWRFVVYNTPRLWASLHVALPFAPRAHFAKTSHEILEKATVEFEVRVQLHQHAISAWLYRSGNCLLSISIHPYNMGIKHSLPSAKVQSYLDLIFAFAHRLGSLDITVPRDDLSRLLASIPFFTFPVLRVLRMNFSLRTTHGPQWMNSGLLNVKHLSVLELERFPYPISVTPSPRNSIAYRLLVLKRMKAAETVKSDVAPLTSVTFASLKEKEMDIRPFLQQYIEDGIIVSIKSSIKFLHQLSRFGMSQNGDNVILVIT
ncbi:hypothetical protein BDZ97DRAFT_1755035 [Flammula alnicola]|nr:hypothetical protein BDZ97DRAFT_1755035 [Flammula alnicola]